MNFPLCMLISVLVLSIYTTATSGENASSKKKPPSKDEDQIIDDLEEGSGYSHPDGRNDMVYSGSGFGPDDEDAEVDDDLSHGGPPSNGKPNKPSDTDVGHADRTIPMPNSPSSTPSTTTSTTTTKAAEPPVIEINKKSREPETKILTEKQPPEHGFGNADKSPAVDDASNGHNHNGVDVVDRDRTTSFFAQPGILAAVIGGAVVGLLCAILVVMFIVYRMRKKDEGSYPLEEMKRCPATNPYIKPNHREFFA